MFWFCAQSRKPSGAGADHQKCQQLRGKRAKKDFQKVSCMDLNKCSALTCSTHMFWELRTVAGEYLELKFVHLLWSVTVSPMCSLQDFVLKYVQEADNRTPPVSTTLATTQEEGEQKAKGNFVTGIC